MKRRIIFFLSSIILLQATHMHAMSDSWQRGKAAVQSRMQKARTAVAQSKTLQAVSKFVQRKPLSAQEKAILKRVSLTAAMVAIVASATGLSAAAVRQRMASNRDQVVQELKEAPFDAEAAQRSLILKAATDQGIDVSPNMIMGDREFILAIINKSDHHLETFYCRAKGGDNNITEKAAGFVKKIADGRKYTLGTLVADYILEQAKSADYSWGGKVESIRARLLEEKIEKDFGITCSN